MSNLLSKVIYLPFLLLLIKFLAKDLTNSINVDPLVCSLCKQYILCIPPFCWGVEPLTKLSKRKRGLDRISIFRRVAGKEGGCSFYIKKSQNQYLKTKKVYKQKCFSLITKNLNWEILTKN